MKILADWLIVGERYARSGEIVLPKETKWYGEDKRSVFLRSGRVDWISDLYKVQTNEA